MRIVEKLLIKEIDEFSSITFSKRFIVLNDKEKNAITKLMSDGLVYRASDWSYRLTPAGKIVASSIQ